MATKSNDMEIVLVYRVVSITEDGLVKIPKESYGDGIFSINYDTQEEALKAIRDNDIAGYEIIATTIRRMK